MLFPQCGGYELAPRSRRFAATNGCMSFGTLWLRVETAHIQIVMTCTSDAAQQRRQIHAAVMPFDRNQVP
jgi:hypothetical protein